MVSRHLVDGKRKEKSRKLPTRTRLRGEAENVLAYNDAQRMGFLTTELVYLNLKLFFQADICVPCFKSNFYLFLASVFGVLPENIDKVFWNNFAEPLEAVA